MTFSKSHKFLSAPSTHPSFMVQQSYERNKVIVRQWEAIMKVNFLSSSCPTPKRIEPEVNNLI